MNSIIRLVLVVGVGVTLGGVTEAAPPQQRVTGTCAVGSAIRVINENGTVVCETDDDSGGTVTNVGTGSGLTGGPITTSGTISVDSAQVQTRVTGSCSGGSSIRIINENGTVVCEADDVGVTAVTASAPLASTGGATPNISLPGVIIQVFAGNTAIGTDALVSNIGFNNTASGVSALQSNSGGNFNTASGVNALVSNTTGSANTASGVNALQSNITGSFNTAIGANAGRNLTTGGGNIYLNNQGAASESGTIRIGVDGTQTRAFIAGIASATVSNDAPVLIDIFTGQLGTLVSSARYKRDIAPMGTSTEKVLALRPVTFAYKNDAQGVTRYGLIAEEVATVYPELVSRTATGEVQTVKYHELIPILLNELQRQRQEFQQQLAELRAFVGQGRGVEAVIPSATVAGR